MIGARTVRREKASFLSQGCRTFCPGGCSAAEQEAGAGFGTPEASWRLAGGASHRIAFHPKIRPGRGGGAFRAVLCKSLSHRPATVTSNDFLRGSNDSMGWSNDSAGASNRSASRSNDLMPGSNDPMPGSSRSLQASDSPAPRSNGGTPGSNGSLPGSKDRTRRFSGFSPVSNDLSASRGRSMREGNGVGPEWR